MKFLYFSSFLMILTIYGSLNLITGEFYLPMLSEFLWMGPLLAFIFIIDHLEKRVAMIEELQENKGVEK